LADASKERGATLLVSTVRLFFLVIGILAVTMLVFLVVTAF
jgi:hypothetical protein